MTLRHGARCDVVLVTQLLDYYVDRICFRLADANTKIDLRMAL